MAQKANKSGAKKAAAAKPARKPARVQAASTVKGAKRSKSPPPSKSPPKSPPKGRDKPAMSKGAAAAKPAAAKAGLKTPVKPASAVKAPVAARPQGQHPATKVSPAAIPAPAAASAVRTMPAAVAKLAGQRIVGPAAIKPPAPQPAAALPKKPVNQRHGFKTGEWIVYPAHGVGRISAIEEQEIAGISLELFVITFEKDKMTLRVPTGKSQSVGMRKLADEATVKKAMETLKGRARIKRTMWSRRAQEYEAKINSGDLVSIAEVVRDLYRSESQPEQSYSERQLYEAALDRMAREIAAVERLDERGAVQRITEVLAKSAKGRRLTTEEAEIKAA
jgi:CarD family transcriptional regulator